MAKRQSVRSTLNVKAPYVDYRDVGGRKRGVLALPETTAQAREAGKSVAKREIASGQAKIKSSQLSRRQRKQASNAKNSLIAYADNYGTDEQKEFFEKADKAKLRYLLESGAVQAEEVFNYDDVTDKAGFKLSETPKAEVAIQQVIDTYNELYR